MNDDKDMVLACGVIVGIVYVQVWEGLFHLKGTTDMFELYLVRISLSGGFATLLSLSIAWVQA